MDASSKSYTADPLRILVVDDFGPFRSTLCQFLDSFGSLRVVGEAADGNSAVEMASHLVPQVISMDVKMPRMDGVEATRCIKKVLPGSHVIGVSVLDDTMTQDAMKAAGSSAFAMKDCADALPRVIAKLTGTRIV
jgi:DNA-binding NarL/FixJ family response regulator